MIADLYICDKTFSHNGTDTDKVVCRRIVETNCLLDAIREHSDENNIFVHRRNLRETVIFSNEIKISDVIDEDGGDKIHWISKDVLDVLKTLVGFPKCEYSLDDMREVIGPDYEDEDHCYGLIAMNEIDGIEESYKVLHKRADFFMFRRHFIAKYPVDAKTFLRNINKYFDNIVLNKDMAFMETRVKGVIHRAKSIVDGLSALNEHFISEYQNRAKDDLNNLDKFLDAFAKRHSIDGGSFEGSKKKDELLCDFDGREGKHYCGPHLKFWPGDKKKEEDHLRIYFCWDNNNLKKVYVGLICQHVKDSKGRHKNHKNS